MTTRVGGALGDARAPLLDRIDHELPTRAAPPAPARARAETFEAKALALAACFVGLQGSYVTWGFLQEKVMTQRYAPGMFPSSVFLVCANRSLALLVGFYLAGSLSTIFGAAGFWEPTIALGPLTVTELITRRYYSRPLEQRSQTIRLLNDW